MICFSPVARLIYKAPGMFTNLNNALITSRMSRCHKFRIFAIKRNIKFCLTSIYCLFHFDIIDSS